MEDHSRAASDHGEGRGGFEFTLGAFSNCLWRLWGDPRCDFCFIVDREGTRVLVICLDLRR